MGAACGDERLVAGSTDATTRATGLGSETTTTTYLPGTYTAGPAECADIEAFAELLTDTGIISDYQPSSSPAELAASVEVAVSGHLTGAAGEVEGSREDHYRAFDVAVDEVIAGDGVAVGDVITVHESFNPVRAPGWEPASTSVPAGAPVAVFASWYDDIDGLHLASEGMTVSCPGGPRLGLTGSSPGWLELADVDDVVAAARGDR